MIDINRIVIATKKRLNDDVVKQEKSEKFAQIYSSRYQLFSTRLIDACKSQKDRPRSLDDLGFIANPERLISKMAYMSIGDIRKKSKSNDSNIKPEFSEDETHLLNSWYELGDETEFANLTDETDCRKIEYILIAHGLSPTTDSLGLLMDIGRAYRYSEFSGLQIKVLLADISWMSSNRSIRQFNSLSEQMIDEGLRICLDKRQRLYEALNIQAITKKIISYERSNTINSVKLKKISNYYTRLAKALWGERTEGQLNIDVVKIISKSLQSLEHVNVDVTSSIPEHMQVFSQFPGVLQNLEDSLEDHLQILRSVAKHFNSYDEEIFTYFFAQYYAQKEFRSNCLKIAPISETKFDKPFDDLDKYFSSWGDGHSTADLLSSGIKKISSEEKLSAIYLPQYRFGDVHVLPYNSLSLDILRLEEKNHKILEKVIFCLDIEQSDEVLLDIIYKTPTIHKNRILADVLSFLMLCSKSVGELFIYESFKNDLGYDFQFLLEKIHPSLKTIYLQEKNAIEQKEVKNMWTTWFSKLEDTSENKLTYIPLHLFCLLFESKDWEVEDRIQKFSNLIRGTSSLYRKLTE